VHNLLRTWLAHPLTAHVNIDDPSAVEVRRRIVREKPFLQRIYQEWYEQLATALASTPGPVLELGAGAGFLRDRLSSVVTSDVFHHAGIDVVMDGSVLPIADASLGAIVMIDVFHHIATPRSFFAEATRCVRGSGAIVMIEPWVTTWSRLVYGRFHHEPFRPEAGEWEFPSQGPMSAANGALPWIVFERDRKSFERQFPDWRIATIKIQMPFRYLASGGVSMRSLTPGWSFKFWRTLERALTPWMPNLGMFALIKLCRR
jgi:hypothetical protein